MSYSWKGGGWWEVTNFITLKIGEERKREREREREIMPRTMAIHSAYARPRALHILRSDQYKSGDGSMIHCLFV